MSAIFLTLAIIFTAYLSMSGFYQLILAVASKRKGKVMCKFDGKPRKFLVLVPSYQEDAVITHSTKKNMALRYLYPKSKFDYVVISDGLQPETNAVLRNMGAKVHEVSFEKSTKVKSLQSAMRAYDNDYDGVVLFDADNTANVNYLFRSSHYLSCGHQVIQGIRKAANEHTSIALMDGLSESANTEMLCKGANRLGFSSKLSGSSMVFDYKLFKDLIFKLEAIGGFDKELELALTKAGVFIDYAEDLVVYDEKVASAGSFAKQRGRWLQAQYTFFFKSIGNAIVRLFHGQFDYFHKVMQLALPPRVLTPFGLGFFALLGFLIGTPVLGIIALTGLIATVGSYLLVLPIKDLLKNSGRIMSSIPKLVISTFKALSLMNKSRKTFIHTKHEFAHK